MLTRADVFYGEALVERSCPGTFFAVVLGDSFYLGLQQGGSGYSKRVHFAVWDPADPIVYQGDGVRAVRFGGEGTGWTTYYPFEWKTSVSYGFLIHLSPDGSDAAFYRAYFFDPEGGRWKHLATVRRTVGVVGMTYFGSFVEDFSETSWMERSFLTGHQWARYDSSQWVDLRRGYFNCSLGWTNPYTNSYNGEVAGQYFRLATGGATARASLPGDLFLREASLRPPALPVDPPQLGPPHVLNGRARIPLSGCAGLEYELSVSEDLLSWEVLTSATAPLGEPFSDGFVVGGSRYYRAMLRQP